MFLRLVISKVSEIKINNMWANREAFSMPPKAEHIGLNVEAWKGQKTGLYR